MIRLTKAVVARWLERLLHTHDTPRRTAAAFALGVLIGFSPLLGLHTILCLVLAFALDLNRVAVLVGAYANLPWFIGPYYSVATILGAALLGTRLPPEFLQDLKDLLAEWTLTDLLRLVEVLRPLLGAYLLGSTLLATVAAAVSYRVALSFILARRRHHAPARHSQVSH